MEGSWFGESVPNRIVMSLSIGAIAAFVAEMLLTWRRSTNASYQQMVERLAIQKVALAAATAYPGQETKFIESDFLTTEFYLKFDLEPADAARLERQYFLRDGSLFGVFAECQS
ncbi:hypothetical protein AB9K41_04490 [Cribrihabitans sp. XS_ASV171]